MSKNDDCIRVEAGQIVNPENFPFPNELVCIQVAKVFDQVAIRDCIQVTVRLESNAPHPKFTLEDIRDLDIEDIKVLSKTDALNKPGFKKLKLAVKVSFKVLFNDGTSQHEQCGNATFILTINEIYCPDCLTQIGLVRFPKEHHDKTIDLDGSLVKVEAIFEVFNETLNPATGVLNFEIGGFFIVKCECVVQLLIPAYGYCPVPKEQINPSNLTCTIFNDRTRTPFPTRFFPEQKWNPLGEND